MIAAADAPASTRATIRKESVFAKAQSAAVNTERIVTTAMVSSLPKRSPIKPNKSCAAAYVPPKTVITLEAAPILVPKLFASSGKIGSQTRTEAALAKLAAARKAIVRFGVLCGRVFNVWCIGAGQKAARSMPVFTHASKAGTGSPAAQGVHGSTWSFRGAGKAREPGIQIRKRMFLDSGQPRFARLPE